MASYAFTVEVGAEDRLTRSQVHEAINEALDRLRPQGLRSREVWDAE